MAESLKARGIRNRIEVIPHGVDLRRFRPVSSEAEKRGERGRLGLSEQDEVLLFVGPLSRRKGADVLLDAWNRVAAVRPRARLVLVGPTMEAPAGDGATLESEVRRRLAAASAGDRVTWVGRAEHVEQFLRAADLLVFPSRREGMPNVVCEAFSCGLATVLSPFLGLPAEFGNPGREYLLATHAPESVAAAALELLADPDRRRVMGAAARAWAERTLDVEESLDRYSGLCRELAGDEVTSGVALEGRKDPRPGRMG